MSEAGVARPRLSRARFAARDMRACRPLMALAAEESRHQDRSENHKDAEHQQAKPRFGQAPAEDPAKPAA